MNQLQKFFKPTFIAVVGASNTKGKVGNDLIVNLKNNFSGVIYPLNLKDGEIEGIKAFASVKDLPQAPDLSVMAIPAESVPGSMEELAVKGCRNFVVISAGFKEAGTAGVELEKKLAGLKSKYRLRILGPNCLGYINTRPAINASFAAIFPKAGNVAFFSQSGALGTAILDMAEAQKLGLSYFISLGNKMDIDELDLLDYLSNDKNTKVILAYLENITFGQKFIEQAKAVSWKKPVIILKSGKTAEGSRAVSSHTGSLAGAAEIYSAAFKQAGVIEAEDVMDFFDLAEGFSYQSLPSGNRVAIITNAGGPGILLTDYLPKYGLKIAELSAITKNKLKNILPAAANIHNPVDVLGDALADRYAQAFEITAKDKNIDAIIVALTPQKMTQIRQTAEIIGRLKTKTDKPVILCFMGEKAIIDNYDIFSAHRLPQFNYPASAVKVLGAMHQYYLQQQEKPAKLKPVGLKINRANLKILQGASGNLTEDICRRILANHQFPLHRAELAKNTLEAVKIAKTIGYPLVLKIVSKQVVHKSDVGGVKVGIKDETQLLAAIAEMNKNIVQKVKGIKIDGYLIGEIIKGQEVIIGLKRDPQFGVTIMLGLGGVYTEIFKDVTFRVAPIDLAEAKKMIGELKIYPLFVGARGQKPLDMEALAELLLQFSRLALAYPQIKEIDFNPVMVLEKGRGAKIVDVRMMV